MTTIRLAALCGLLAIGCGGADALGGEDALGDVDESAQGLDGKAWCVDHPCPDLISVKRSECPKVWDLKTRRYRLAVRIKNQWTLTAGTSITRVSFDSYGGGGDYTTPPITPGALYDFTALLPDGCLEAPGCVWHVKADADDDVDETSGTNNGIVGACIY